MRVRIALIIPMFLLASNCYASDKEDQPNYKLPKIYKQLDALGVNNSEVKQFAAEVSAKSKDGYLKFTEQDAPASGKLSLRFNFKQDTLDRQMGQSKLQLVYKPFSESHFDVRVSKNGAIAAYTLHFQ